MKQQYRINSWRFDVPYSCHSTPTFEAETPEECAQKAREHFQIVSNKPENVWDGMKIFRIDSPAVAEKVTFLEKNGRQEGN